MSSLSINEQAVPFYEQKELECAEIDMKIQEEANGSCSMLKKRGPKGLSALERKFGRRGELFDAKKYTMESEVRGVLEYLVQRVEDRDYEEK